MLYNFGDKYIPFHTNQKIYNWLSKFIHFVLQDIIKKCIGIVVRCIITLATGQGFEPCLLNFYQKHKLNSG